MTHYFYPVGNLKRIAENVRSYFFFLFPPKRVFINCIVLLWPIECGYQLELSSPLVPNDGCIINVIV